LPPRCAVSEPQRGTGRLSSPKLLFAKTPAEFNGRFQSDLAKCRSLLKRILETKGPRTIENTLEPFDELSRRLEELLSQPKFLFDVHPEAAMRQAGDEAYQEADRFATELSLNREVYDAVAALDMSGEGPATRFAVKKILRDFHLAGVDRDDATRARVKALRDELIAKRDDLARLLDYDHFADYVTADKMIETAAAAQAFVSKVATVAEPRARDDFEELLSRKRQDVPGANTLERWDLNYYTELVRAESYAFDAKRLRPYFEFRKVLDGLFAITSRMFGVRYRRISGTPAWHPSVEVYDLYRGRQRLGRVYLDLHPRKDKYTHAAAAGLVVGTAGRRLPQAALMCNFPDPEAGHRSPPIDFSHVRTPFHP